MRSFMVWGVGGAMISGLLLLEEGIPNISKGIPGESEGHQVLTGARD